MTRFLKRPGELIDAIMHSRYVVGISSILFLIIIGLAFFLVYQDARVMRDQINGDFNQQQLILARQAASQIDAFLRDITLEVNDLAFQTSILGSGEVTMAMRAVFRRIHSKGVMAIALTDQEGRVLELQGGKAINVGASLDVEEQCLETESGLLHTSRVNIDTSETGDQIVYSFICATVPGTDGHMVIAMLDVAKLVSSVTERIRSGKTGYAWVINESGMFLYHPEQDFIGKNAFTARRERKPYVSFSKINEIMKDRMLEGYEGTGTYISGWHRGISGEITKLIGYTPVRSASLPFGSVWSVAVVAPISEVAEAVHRVYTKLFWTEAALIAGLLIFGLLAVTYHRRLSRSLEARVSRQKEYISSLLESSVDAIVFINNENCVEVWNRGAEMIFGYTADEMLGKTFHRLIPPELDAKGELTRIQNEVNEKGYVRHYVATRITKDGRRITIDLSRTLVREQNGEIAGSIAIIRDITEKAEIDQRIYNAEKLASIGILAAGVAHEINNPLAVILGFTDLLLEKADKGSPEYEDLKLIEFNANNAKKVVENMLGFARVTEGLEDKVDVSTSIETVISICKNTLMTNKIDLVLDVADQLPCIRGDAREFQQVIFNMINNAVAAMALKAGTLTISAQQDDGFVHISVTDTGVGIPDRIKPQIFDPFFTTKKSGEGTGLGLSLCYGIVKKYGGKMTFTSVSAEDHPEQPSGSTFTVAMPVYDEESGEGGNE